MVAKFDQFISEKPCSLVRIAVEKAMFVEQKEFNELVLFNVEPFNAFIKREMLQIHTFIKPYTNEQVFTEFFDKYILMVKESLNVTLRNPSR